MKVKVLGILCSVIFAFVLISGTKVAPQMTLDEAKAVADVYYSSLRNISQSPMGSVYANSEMNLLNSLGKDHNGHEVYSVLRVPNDIEHLFGGTGVNKNKSMSITNYIGYFQEIALNQKLDFQYTIKNVEFLHNPEAFKGADPPSFARVIVSKKYKSTTLRTTEIVDTMSINLQDRCVCRISNKYSGKAQSIDELMANARNKYNDRKYEDAFALFEKVMEISPKHQDASYYLGVMLYKNHGCKHKYTTRKERDQKAVEYWRMSEKGENAIKYYTDNR